MANKRVTKDSGRKKQSRDSKKRNSKGKKYIQATKCSVGPAAGNAPKNATFTPVVNKPRFERKNRQGQEKSGDQQKSQASSSAGKVSSIAQQWSQSILSAGIRDIRKTFVESVKPIVPSGSKEAFALDANTEKNRYDDVELLDKTRVKIKDSPGDDYIHASFVEISSDMIIICAQGPLENTINQFWLMVAEQSCKVILQLCQFMEDGKEKSAPYFPVGNEGDEKEYGTVKVRVVGRKMGVGAMKKVERTLIEVTVGAKVLETTHLLYSGWPDHSVPESLPTYLEMRTLIRRLANKGPVIAHCSAGIGRSGSYAAIEMACYELISKKDRNFTMINLMQRLREQRMQAVQNDQQFVFIHRMILEILLVEKLIDKSQELTNFIKDYDQLIERKKAEIAKLKQKK